MIKNDELQPGPWISFLAGAANWREMASGRNIRRACQSRRYPIWIIIVVGVLAALAAQTTVVQAAPAAGDKLAVGGASPPALDNAGSDASILGTTTSEHRFNSDFHNPGDRMALASGLLRSVDTSSQGANIRFPLLIDNIVSSNRKSGPGQASVALGLRSIKPDFLTSTTTQEVDGLYIIAKTGLHGDTSGILVDAGGMIHGTSFVNMIEGTASLYGKDNSVARRIRYQGPSFDQIVGTSFGQQIYAEKGKNDHAILISGTSPSDYFVDFIYASTGGVNKWRVDSEGNEVLSGAVTARNVKLNPVRFSTLPECNTQNSGTLAYITDASAPITTWHQQVESGGGSSQAFIACNGSGWFAFDY